MSSFRAVIIGTGSYVPERVLTNRELETMVETSDEWITTRSGIKERRVVAPGENVSDMAANAGRLALEDAGLEPSDIDLILVATSSPEMIMPSTACITQAKLGASCPAFDLQAACSGFVYGLSSATAFIESGAYRTVMLIGSDALTRHLDWNDRGTCVLFGDGAGAIILRRTKSNAGVLSSVLGADGRGADLLRIEAGGSGEPGSERSVSEGLHYLKMNGTEVFKFAVRTIPEIVDQAFAGTGLTVSDISYIIPHQANQRIIAAAAERMGINNEKVVINMDRYGNTSTASIPLALDEVNRAGKLKSGDILVFVGFGAGLTWGASVVRWDKEAVE